MPATAVSLGTAVAVCPATSAPTPDGAAAESSAAVFSSTSYPAARSAGPPAEVPTAKATTCAPSAATRGSTSTHHPPAITEPHVPTRNSTPELTTRGSSLHDPVP